MPSGRHELFTSSLEQAQQQFFAASSTGVESRALNLYYGISQAGRAVSAALTPTGHARGPEVNGHGLRVINLASVRANNFWEVQIAASGGENSSYGRLASLLRCDPLASPVTLGAVWHMIPELCLDYPVGDYLEPRWTNRPFARQGDAIDPRSFTVQATAAEAENDAEVLRLMYPDLSGADLIRYGGGSYSESDDGTRTEETLFAYTESGRPRKLRNSSVLMPACREGSKALDPLLTWWVLLYALSMVTRYEPVNWTRIIDVNRSPLAVPLEVALHKALEAVPAQVYSALTMPGRP